MFRRPKPGESEDDLLEFQKEFLAKKMAPSACLASKPGDKRKPAEGNVPDKDAERDVVKMEGLPSSLPVSDQTPPVKKSRFKSSQEKRAQSKINAGAPDGSGEPRDVHDDSLCTVLTKIIERDTRNAQCRSPSAMSQAFPSVVAAGKSQPAGTGKKKSVFAKQFEAAPDVFGLSQDKLVPTAPSIDQTKHPDGSYNGSNLPCSIDGSGLSATFGKSEVQKIHQENAERLASMSAAEALAEQKKLIEMLDPKLVEFLKTRKSKKDEDPPMSVPMEDSDELIMKPKQGQQKAKNTSRIEESELPVTVDKSWVHMDKVEQDKLEWMKDLPPPSAGDTKTGQQARFDFHGNLIPPGADVPVNIGLHHHGNEPERAGYTLEEVFTLARSSNIQQRALALTTLAKVISQAKAGKLSQLVQSPIFPSVLDAGVVFLVRWSLDDSVDSVVAAAVSALNAMLVNQADELALDTVFPWHQGHRVACQAPTIQQSLGIKLPDVADEKGQETDADIARQDLVKALVYRMDVIRRLKYILEKVRPHAPTVVEILQILVRLARHSTQMAYQVYNHAGLMKLILNNFLPFSWSVMDVSQPLSLVYGVPLSAAMKLVRTLCQAGRHISATMSRPRSDGYLRSPLIWVYSVNHMSLVYGVPLLAAMKLVGTLCQSGRHISATMVSDYQLLDRLLRFLADDPRNLGLPESEAFGLQIEGFNTWRTCLSYGLADEMYIELYPKLLEQLRGIQEVLYRPVEEQTRLTAVIAALEMAVCVASTPQKQGFQHSQDGTFIQTERSEEELLPMLNWGHVEGLIQPVSLLLKSLLADIAENYQIKKPILAIPSACLNFVATFFTKVQTVNTGADAVSKLDEVKRTYIDCSQHWNSIGFETIRSKLSQSSNMLQPLDQKSPEQHPSLPEYGGSSVPDGQLLPVVCRQSPFNFLSAFLRLTYSLCKIHKGLIATETDPSCVPVSSLLGCQDIRSYLRKLAPGKPSHLTSSYFTKFENHLQYYILKLATLQATQTSLPAQDRSVLHSVALNLLTSVHYGDEHLTHDILSTCIFNPVYWRENTEETADIKLEEMSISKTPLTHLRSATEKEVTFTMDQLAQDAKTNLSGVRSSYLMAFAQSEPDVIKSRNHFSQMTQLTGSCFTSNIGECLLPKDWMFVPLIELYNTFASVGADVQNALSASQLDSVRNVLRWIFLVEVERPGLLGQVSITLKLSRVMCVFLTGNDMFLDQTVHCFMAGLLRYYTKPSSLARIDFEETIPGLTSFYDLFVGLLQQYEAVSFGDSLFGCYVLLPLQRKHGIQYRRGLWTEYTGILRTLSVSVAELLVPIEAYLEPEEEDVGLIRLYFQSLYRGTLRATWSPVLYLMATHHVNRFIYTQDGQHKTLKAQMIVSLVTLKNEELRRHILYYKKADVTLPFGMELYQELPPIREKYLDLITSVQKS